MSYKLVIAEKPSVAQSIAKVIGADKREDGYLEGNRRDTQYDHEYLLFYEIQKNMEREVKRFH
jgi:DNA topoisomerase IA